MRILGVCGGNGVFLYAMREHVVGNIEPRSVFKFKDHAQWRANFGGFWHYDINQVPVCNELDAIIGHPDCGHSSVLSYSRKKTLGDAKENHSLAIYIESVSKYRPKMFVLENLSKLRQTFGKEALEESFKGYKLKWVDLSCDQVGNSQVSRKRLVIFGIRKDLDVKTIWPFIRLPRNPEKPQPIEKLLKGCKQEGITGNIREGHDTVITLYGGFKISARQLQEEWLGPRINDRRWKVEGRRFTTAPGVYRNRKGDFPATVRKSNREFTPNGLMMSPRERARIQGLPDTFVIYHEDASSYWINKGRFTVTKTPPYEFSVWVNKILTNLKHFNLI